MKFTPEHLEELHVLMLYHSSSSLEGIKVHKSADPGVIAAAKRLFDDGFITQADGGYLTPRGSEAAEHAQLLLSMLNAGDD
jgi:uncharacterized protein (TIGR02647 family)